MWRLLITKMENFKYFTKSKNMENILKFSGFQGEFNATRYKFQLKNLKIAEMSPKTPLQISVSGSQSVTSDGSEPRPGPGSARARQFF